METTLERVAMPDKKQQLNYTFFKWLSWGANQPRDLIVVNK